MGYLDYAGLQYLWGKLKEKFAPKSHSHDDRYYTEAEMDGKLNSKVGFSKISAELVAQPGKDPYIGNVEGEDVGIGEGSYYSVINLGSYSGGNFRSQIAVPYQDSIADSNMYIRTAKNTTWRPWRKIIHSGNIGEQTVAKANIADTANSLSGLSSRSGQGWGVQTGTFVHGECDSTGGDFAFRRDCPAAGQLSMILDGRFYQNEGQYRVLDTSDEPNLNVNSANYINDVGDHRTLSFAYSKSGLDYGNYSWLAGWNDGELRAVNKNQFSTAGHTHSFASITGKPSTYTPSAHTHDDRYYTETEMNAKLDGKSNVGHTHDDRYYTESEIDSKLSGKANSNHSHYSITTVADNRNTNTTPNDYRNTFIFQGLKDNSKINSPSSDTYSYLLGLRGWNDPSGGNSHELAFNNTGVYWRNGSTEWNGWNRLYTENYHPNADHASSADYATNAGSANGVTPEWSGSVDLSSSSWLAAWSSDGKKIKAMSTGTFAKASHTHTKAQVGLSNVDNTADANKSVKYATSAGSASSATKATSADSAGKLTMGDNQTALSGTTSPTAGLTVNKVYDNGYPTTYGNVITVHGSGSGQIVAGWSGTSGAVERLYYRNKRDTSDANWSSWKTVAFTDDKPAAAGTADSATTSNGVKDYNDANRTIKIGFAGAGLTAENLNYIAGYTENGTKIKDVSKDVLKSWIGLGSYLPLIGGTMSGQITKSTGGSWIGDRDRAAIKSGYAGDGSYGAVAAMATKNGYWTIGNIGGNESLIFNYSTDAKYNAGKNETSQVYLPAQAGTIITSATIGGQSVNYATSAGTATNATNATTATKLSSSAGSNTQPVYFSGGKPVVIGYTIAKSVPADAKFTDTTYGIATSTSNGLMSSDDKAKLDDFSKIISIQKQIKLTTDWQDTGIAGTSLDTGTYVVQVSGFNSDYTYLYGEIYSGVMSWYSGETNSLNSDEIFLHNAGHASNGNHIYLRTVRKSSGNGGLRLQIASKIAASGTDTLTFKFRRLI